MRGAAGAGVAPPGRPPSRRAAFLASRRLRALPGGRDRLAEECGALRLDPEVRNADPARLSTGERSRLALLRLLLHAPEVLLLDEPTANLDQDSRTLVVERIHRYRSEHEAPVLWVSHLPEVVAAADRVLTLPEGTVGPPPDESAARGENSS